MTTTDKDQAIAWIMLGMSVCAQLLVRSRVDVLVRLGGDPTFAIMASKLILESGLRSKGKRSQQETTLILRKLVDNIENLECLSNADKSRH